MSGKAMGHVWDLELPANKRMILLAYTDHADHEGCNIWPSVGLIAWKTGYSERQVKRLTKELVEDDKILIPDGRGPHGVKRYKLDWSAGVVKEPYVSDKVSPKEKQSDKMSHKANKRRGDILTPKGDPSQESDILSIRGDILSKQSDIQMSPKPSEEPSLEPSIKEEEILPPPPPIPDIDPSFAKATTAYEQNIGLLTGMIGDEIKDWLKQVPLEWFLDAIKEATMHNKRSMAYMSACLRRWQRDGRGKVQPPPVPAGSPAPAAKPTRDPDEPVVIPEQWRTKRPEVQREKTG